ncbi:hypothetical protein [Anaerotignum sp.]|uniref:hypothetical protein n=1 Tax=Anaerotignum sp. TaxID=2039241 RepID=UPI0027147D10|nr:hypothetical protein [Anaerotignum sp.]
MLFNFADFCIREIFNGNGYPSADIKGIILRNSKIEDKAELVYSFDGVNSLLM